MDKANNGSWIRPIQLKIYSTNEQRQIDLSNEEGSEKEGDTTAVTQNRVAR